MPNFREIIPIEHDAYTYLTYILIPKEADEQVKEKPRYLDCNLNQLLMRRQTKVQGNLGDARANFERVHKFMPSRLKYQVKQSQLTAAYPHIYEKEQRQALEPYVVPQPVAQLVDAQMQTDFEIQYQLNQIQGRTKPSQYRPVRNTDNMIPSVIQWRDGRRVDMDLKFEAPFIKHIL